MKSDTGFYIASWCGHTGQGATAQEAMNNLWDNVENDLLR